VAEYSLVAAAVLWEGYLGDLFIAYLNRDQTRFRQYVLPNVTLDATDEIARRAKVYLQPRFTAHLTVAQLRAILDARNYNVTFATTAELKQYAGKLLVPADAARFTGISSSTAATIEAWKSMRNYLAHRSKAAKEALNAALSAPSLPARFKLGAGTRHVHDVGSYLLAVPDKAAQKRLPLYLSEMESVGTALCP
jgi:hypothetical protein